MEFLVSSFLMFGFIFNDLMIMHGLFVGVWGELSGLRFRFGLSQHTFCCPLEALNIELLVLPEAIRTFIITVR